jgi:membrane protein DedA with SNARE-associated domain/rhodanese-related sulfurtransferase
MDAIVTLIQQYGLLVIFLNLLLEEAGLPIPSIPVVMVAASMTGETHYGIGGIILAGTAGALIADIAWYRSGRRYGRRVLSLLCRVSLSPDTCVRQTESLFVKAGPMALVFAKFVPGLANVCVALAGITRVRFTTFLVLDTLGAALYVGAVALLGLIFADAVEEALATLESLGRYGLMLLVGLLALYLAVRWAQRRLFMRQLRMDRVTVDDLVHMLGAGEMPVILDVRSKEARALDGIIPGAIGAYPAENEPLIMAFPRDREIVVYCACPNEASAAVAAKHLKRAGFKRIRPLLGGIDAWIGAGQPIEKPDPGIGKAA